MGYYDPNRAPDPDEWLMQDESERIDAAATYHRIKGIEAEGAQMHAMVHAIVETQLAEDVPEVADALSRLVAGGLDRHDALHAIGSVLVGHLHQILRTKSPQPPPAYFSELKRLTPQRFKRGR